MKALPGSALEFELVDEPRPSPLSSRGAARRQRAGAPFASVTMQQQAAPAGGRGVGSSSKGPAFTIASAVESKPLNLEGVPQWRIAAGNLAAGATAGCAVEAGAVRGTGRGCVHLFCLVYLVCGGGLQ